MNSGEKSTLILCPGEKLRERLDRLEALAASATQAQAIGDTPAVTAVSQIVTTAGLPTIPNHHNSQSPLTNTSFLGFGMGQANENRPRDIAQVTLSTNYAPSDVSFSSSAATPVEFQHLFPPKEDTPSAQSLPGFDASDVSVSNSSVATPEEYQDLMPQPEDTTLVPSISQTDDTMSALSLWNSTTHIDPTLLSRNKPNDGLGHRWTTTIDCGCSIPHAQIQTQGPTPYRYGGLSNLNYGSGATRANLLSNHLRIDTVCIITAFYTLGMYVGITEEMICADKSLSPFFWSTAESADDMVKAHAVYTSQNIFKTLKPDLRPSSEQITIRHHPYIDILPFPTLRNNLIAHQEEIDEDEFFYDMLNGLVCWGGAGVGKKDREDSTGYASTGTPWDVRSWEGRVWFLKKYWNLLGGEDGELVRQSEWWRNIRGDDTLDMEVHS